MNRHLISSLVVIIGIYSSIGASHASTSIIVPQRLVASMIDVSLSAQTSIDTSRNAIKYDYKISSKQNSMQPVWAFTVKCDSPVLASGQPSGWGSAIFKGKPFLVWGVDEDSFMLYPGSYRNGFYLISIGMPGVQTYYAQGDAPNPRVEEVPEGISEGDFGQALDIFHNSIKRSTIGPTSVSVNSSVTTIISYIINQKHEAESLGWIDNSGIVNSLDKKLDAAQHSLNRGQFNAARNQLQAFQNEVRAQAGIHIDANAVSILMTGVEVAIQGL